MESKKLIAENRAAAVTATLPKLNKATATALAAAVAQQKEDQKNHQQHHASRKTDKKKTPQAKSVAPPPPPLNPLQVMKLEVIEAFQAREKKRNEDNTRDQRHRDLQAVVDRLQEALVDEQKEKTRLRGLTASLRHRVETVRAACGTLDRQRVQYETFRDAAKVARELRSPEMLAPTGLLTFANMEGGDRRNGGATSRSSKPATPASSVAPDNCAPASPGRSNFALPGRSAKRTAYCTDYGNTRYLGIREADAKEELQRRIGVLLKERDDLAAATAGTVGDNNNNSHQHSHSGSTSSPHREEYRGLSIYGYRGADSRLNLDEFHKRSSRRTKMYRDYEGNFIQMDSCDWPMTDGVNF